MHKDEEAYKKYLSENGIEVEDSTTKEAQPVETKPEEGESETEKTTDTKSESTESADAPEKKETSKKDSIYDAYKEKKRVLREVSEVKDNLEKELEEKNARIAELESFARNASTQEEKQEVKEGIDKLADEYNLDPSFLKKLSSELIKTIKPTDTQSVDTAYSSKVKELIQEKEFNEEFEETLPFIEETFGTIGKDDIKTIKSELDKLAHTKEFHDKDLDYIVFKNKSRLSTIVSPKKRGLETKTRNEEKETTEESVIDFSSTPDFESMTQSQVAAWEKEYAKLKSNGSSLATGPNGKKFFI